MNHRNTYIDSRHNLHIRPSNIPYINLSMVQREGYKPFDVSQIMTIYDTLLGSIGLCILLMATIGQVSSLTLIIIGTIAISLVGYGLFVSPPIHIHPSPNSGQKSQEGAAVQSSHDSSAPHTYTR